MTKMPSDIHISPNVLDLSTASERKNGSIRLESSAMKNSADNDGRKKEKLFSRGKIISVFVLAAIINLSIFGFGAWKKISQIKSAAFSANAMSEENIAAIENFLAIIQYLPTTAETKKIKELAADFESFKSILGFDRPKKYLLVFQNPSEARATGGFIGSVGVAEIKSGKIKSVSLQDVYNLDGQLRDFVEPPWPIKKISAAWSLHDSNWFFDFPLSAKKISWFYEKGGGETTDGVIAFNPKVIEDILSVTGPIKIEEYGAELNRGNFVEIAQSEAELNYDKTINRPKLFLADFLAKLKETVEGLPLDKKIAIMKNLIANLDEKDIQIAFRGQGAQSFISSHNWDGRVNETDKDYLALVSSNINGFKTDAVIDEAINLATEIAEDGSVTNNLTVTRSHNGGKGDADWYNKVNSDYLRLYLPSGAELLGAEGTTREELFLKDPSVNYGEYLKDEFLSEIEKNKLIDGRNGTEIFEESGKTVFGSWLYVSPGEKAAASWRYRLPFRIKFDQSSHTGIYSLLFQKQSGSAAKKLKQTIIFPASWKVLGNYSEDFTLNIGKIERVLNIEKDRFSPILFQAPAK